MKSPLIHLVIWLSVCAAAVAGYWLWYTAVADKSAAVAGLQNQIDTKTETAARIASARVALSEIAGDESAVRSYFVPETGVVSFINDLEERARALKASIKVTSVSIGNAAERSTLILSLTVNGTFDANMRTIGAIEYAPYNIQISKLSLGKDGKDLWHSNLELVIGSVQASAAKNTP